MINFDLLQEMDPKKKVTKSKTSPPPALIVEVSVLRMRIRKAQKDTDPDADPDHWYFTFTSFFKDKKSYRSHKTVGIKVFPTIFA
jgi:hypothetical protein